MTIDNKKLNEKWVSQCFNKEYICLKCKKKVDFFNIGKGICSECINKLK